MNELHNVSDSTHDQETDADCLGDLDKFSSVRLGASVDEKSTILNKVLWDIDKFLNLVRHYGGEVDGAPGRIELR